MKWIKFVTLTVMLTAILSLNDVRADFTATLGASKDNTMFQNMPNNSGGGAAGIFSGTQNTPSIRRGLISFDVAAAVPAGSTITGVEVSMYLANAPNTNNQTINLHRMLFNWGENTNDTNSPAIGGAGNGVAALSGDATWNENFFVTSTWTSLGPTTAPGATNAYNAAMSGTAVVGGAIDNQQKWLSTACLVSDVQGWLNNPATNFGWAIVNANETSTQTMKAFYSRQATLNNGGSGTAINPAWLPTLTVTYTAATSPSGDYNGNGVVDAADYIVWRNTFGLPASPDGSGADGNGSGTIDDGDFNYWRTQFGHIVTGVGSAATIPEATIWALILFPAMLAFLQKRR